MRLSWSVLLTAALLVASPAAGAHALGLSMEEKVGDYLIDIGYDQQLVAGEKILFDFNLYNARRDGISEAAEYTDVGFEVSMHGNVIFSRRVPRNSAKTYMTATFPASGLYDLHAEFFRGDDKFVEHTFTMNVAEGLSSGTVVGASLNVVEVASYSVGLLVCIAGGILLLRSRRTGPPMPPTVQ